MTEMFGIIATVLAVFGCVLNNRKLIACFYLWIASNVITGWIHADMAVYSLLVRDIIFSGLAIEGLYRWRKKHDTKKNPYHTG